MPNMQKHKANLLKFLIDVKLFNINLTYRNRSRTTFDTKSNEYIKIKPPSKEETLKLLEINYIFADFEVCGFPKLCDFDYGK